MVQILIGDKTFELLSYPTHLSESLSLSFLPGDMSLDQILNLVEGYTGDYVVKADGEVVARFTNFSVVVAIEERRMETGVYAVSLQLEHPTAETRFEMIESTLGNHSTEIEVANEDISNLNTDLVNGLSEKQAEIDDANANIRTANNNIAQANARIDVTNEKVSAAEGQIEGHSNDISDIQTMLEITQEALDDIIMHDPINEEA